MMISLAGVLAPLLAAALLSHDYRGSPAWLFHPCCLLTSSYVENDGVRTRKGICCTPIWPGARGRVRLACQNQQRQLPSWVFTAAAAKGNHSQPFDQLSFWTSL